MGSVAGLHASPTCLPSPFIQSGHLRTAVPTRRPRQFGRSEGAHLGTHHPALHRLTPFTYMLLRPWGAHGRLTRTRNGRAGAGCVCGGSFTVDPHGCGAGWWAARSAPIGAGNHQRSQVRDDRRSSPKARRRGRRHTPRAPAQTWGISSIELHFHSAIQSFSLVTEQKPRKKTQGFRGFAHECFQI